MWSVITTIDYHRSEIFDTLELLECLDQATREGEGEDALKAYHVLHEVIRQHMQEIGKCIDSAASRYRTD